MSGNRPRGSGTNPERRGHGKQHQQRAWARQARVRAIHPTAMSPVSTCPSPPWGPGRCRGQHRVMCALVNFQFGGEAVCGSRQGGEECWVGYMGGQTPNTGTSGHVCLGRVGCCPPLSGGPSPAPTPASPSPMVPPPPRLPHLCSPPMTSLLSGNGPSPTPALLLPGLGPGAETVAQGSSVDPTVGPAHWSCWDL